MRAALNRLIGLKSGAIESSGEISQQEAAAALDTGDKTAGANDALEESFNPQDPKQSPKAALELARKRRQADVAAIVAAVDDYTEDLRRPDRMLDEIDIPRLRAMLMIIAVARWPGSDRSSYKPSHVQVLPGYGPIQMETWPRLIGRVLAAVFNGPNAALRSLKFDRSHDRVTDDQLETLACCVWSAHAAAVATKAIPACAKLSSILANLVTTITVFLDLSGEEVSAPAFADVMTNLDQRFGKQLQLPSLAGVMEKARKRQAVAAG